MTKYFFLNSKKTEKNFKYLNICFMEICWCNFNGALAQFKNVKLPTIIVIFGVV